MALSIGLCGSLAGCSSAGGPGSASDGAADGRSDANGDTPATEVAAADVRADVRADASPSFDAGRPGLCAPVDLVGGVGRNYAGVTADGTGVDWSRPGTAVPGPLLKYDPPCGLHPDGTIVCQVLNDRVVPEGTFKTLAVGGTGYACGIRTDDTLSCWQIETSNISMQPSPPPGSFSKLVAENTHYCGLRSDGQILCWGSPSSFPPPVLAAPLGSATYVNVAAGAGYVCGIKDSGAFDCWARDGNPRQAYYMDLVAGRAFDDLFFGFAYRCGLQRDGTVLCWDNTGIRADTPGGRFVHIIGSDYDICGVQDDGGVICWGLLPSAPPTGFGCCRQPFHDSFSSDPTIRGMNASEYWSWSQSDGTFTVRAPGINGLHEIVYTFWPYAWRNVAARATLRVDSGTGGGLAIWYGGGVAYYFGVYPADKKARLIKLGAAGRTVLAEVDADIAIGETFQVYLAAAGCTLTGSVVGLLALNAVADPGRSGPVGLFADEGGVVTFDSIDVSCIDGDACLPPPP